MNLGHVEFAGAPGSGKSTLCARITGGRLRVSGIGPARLLPAQEIAAARSIPGLGLIRWPRAAATDEALLASPAASVVERRFGDLIRSLAEVVVEGPRGAPEARGRAERWLRRDLVLLVAAEERLSRAARPWIPVLAEGLVQRAVSVLGTGAEAARYADLVERTVRPRAVVHVVGTAEELAGRALARRRAGTEPELHRGLSDERMVAQALEDGQAIARALELLAARGLPVIEVTGSVATEDLLARLGREMAVD